MAFQLLHPSSDRLVPNTADRVETRRMRKDFQFRVSALVLALITLTAVVFAAINFWKEGQYPVPYDGAWWVESGNGLKAERVTAGGPAERADIKPGDQLLAIDGRPIVAAKDQQGRVIKNATSLLERQLYASGVWSKLTYKLNRGGLTIQTQVVLIPADKSLFQGLRL